MVYKTKSPFLDFNAKVPNKYLGYKYTIVGNDTDDVEELIDLLYSFLTNINASFKIGTKALIDRKHNEQSKKLFTIYVTDNINQSVLLDDLKYFLKSYKGGDKIKLKGSEHIVGAIYKREDLDADGNYKPANENRILNFDEFNK